MAEATSSDSSFADFIDTERSYIARRRKTFWPDRAPWPDDRTVGLALSGGGIRSATFCLGFLQTLSGRGLVPHVDYLSTVSGGSYAGSFFGSLFVPSESRGDGKPGIAQPTFDRTRPLQSPRGEEAIRRVRDMGRYLTPSGTSDAFYGGAVVVRNWVAVQFVIGTSALLLFWLMHGIDWVVDRYAWLPPLPMRPGLELAALVMLGATLACGNAYWLTRRDVIPVRRVKRVLSNAVVWALGLVFAFVTAPWWGARAFGGWTPAETGFVRFVAFVAGLALVLIVVAEARFGRVRPPAAAIAGEGDKLSLIAAEDAVRSALSRWMAHCLTLTLTFAVFAVIDWVGHLTYQVVYDWLRQSGYLGLFGLSGSASGPPKGAGQQDFLARLALAWPIMVTVFTPIASFFASRKLKNRRPPVDPGDADPRTSWAPILIVALGALIVIVWLTLWSALAVALHWMFVDQTRDDVEVWWTVLILLVALNVGQSLCFSFINLSSLSTFYADRLRRAYIGASSWGTCTTSVSEDDPQDTIRIHDYYQAGIANGAPLHLINVTVAETIADGSNLVARDRKGKPMHLSPAGIAFEGHQPGTIVAHLRGQGGEQAQGEELPLANWVAISGAAVSAAIGAGTSLGTSILATMANVRLGYWWRSKLAHGKRAAFWADWQDTVQNYLFLELRGKFTGTARSRWYLTDGGHFENTGVYPLLQRRIPFIIVCDNGADPHYQMDDVMRLLGRARTDLGVRITFHDEASLAQRLGPRSPIAGTIGTLAALRRRGSPAEPGGPIAALATVAFPRTDDHPASEGLLLLVKPKIAFTEPPEVLAYHGRASTFPQQTTGDQFFDEEQWEAYRRLGEIAGERLFPGSRPAEMTGWLPQDSMGHDLPPAPLPPPAPPQRLRDRAERWFRG